MHVEECGSFMAFQSSHETTCFVHVHYSYHNDSKDAGQKKSISNGKEARGNDCSVCYIINKQWNLNTEYIPIASRITHRVYLYHTYSFLNVTCCRKKGPRYQEVTWRTCFYTLTFLKLWMVALWKSLSFCSPTLNNHSLQPTTPPLGFTNWKKKTLLVDYKKWRL